MLRLLSPPCLVLIASALLAACSGEKTANEYLKSAHSHIESGGLRSALIEARNAVSQAPENRDARSLLGVLELRLGNPAGAEAELLKTVELGTPESEVAASLAHAYLLLGKFDGLRALDTSKLTGSDLANVLGYQAEAALQQNELQEAVRLAADSLITDPGSAVALTANARLQLLENNALKARAFLATAKEEMPDHSPAWELLGDIESSEQYFPEAVKAYTRAIETGSNILSPLFKRARTHLALDDLESAATDLELLQKGNINAPAIHLLKSEILLRKGEFDDAQLALEQVLRNAPDYQPAVRTLAVTHMLRDSLGQAEQFGKQYLDATNSDDSRILLATIRLQANRLEQAEQTLLPLTDSGRLNVLGAQVLATTLLKQNKLDDAISTMLSLHSNLKRANITEPTSLALETDPTSIMSVGLLGSAVDRLRDTDARPYLSKRDQLIVTATTALAEKKTEKAMESANRLLEMQPNNADVHTLIGRIHLAAGDITATSTALKKAIELDGEQGTAVIFTAMLEMNAGESTSARNILDDALKDAKGSDRVRIILALATVDANTGDEKNVIDRLMQARNESPASYQPSLALADYYAKTSQPEKVLDSLSELSETGLQNPVVKQLRAEAHIALEQFDEAIALVTPMVQAEPGTARWRFLRAKAYAGMKDIDAVNRDLDVALRIEPDHAPSKFAKANLSILVNDLQQAEVQLAQLENMIPGSEELTQLSSRIEAAQQRNALNTVAQVPSETPTNSAQLMDIARAHWASGEQEIAVTAMTDWLDANPEDVTVRLTLANTYVTLNQPDEAIAAFQAVLKNEEDNFIALNNLAWQLRKADPRTAIDLAKRAVDLQPNNAGVLDTLALIQLEQNLLPQAGETFEIIRALQPPTTDPTILYHGARILLALGEKQDAKKILEPLISESIAFPDADAARALYNEL